ncbi:MAG: multidrug transporter permease, partial [Caulobacteraceae bacterium]|nr:multidrug transporter permease [Caulobacteraceae bacterium]
DRLPEPFRTFSRYNPMFYLIDGFRYGFIDRSEGALGPGGVFVLALSLVLLLLVWRLFAIGYRLKT